MGRKKTGFKPVFAGKKRAKTSEISANLKIQNDRKRGSNNIRGHFLVGLLLLGWFSSKNCYPLPGVFSPYRTSHDEVYGGWVGDIIPYSAPYCYVPSSAAVSRRLRHYKALFLVFSVCFLIFLAFGKNPEKNGTKPVFFLRKKPRPNPGICTFGKHRFLGE